MHPTGIQHPWQAPERPVPRWKRWLLPAMVIVLAGAIVASGNPTGVLEAGFALLVAYRMVRRPAVGKGAAVVFLVSIGYIVLGYVNANPSDIGELKDFATIYKFFYYIAAVSLLTGKTWIRAEDGIQLYRTLVWVFVVVYTISRFLFLDDRPTVFTENNYELIPLLLAAVAITARSNALKAVDWVALMYLCAVSGSRSSAVAFVCALIILIRLRLSGKTILQLIGLMAAVSVVVLLMAQRLTERGVEGIDRVVFLNAFLYETSNWSLRNWLFGMPAMTPLSGSTCQVLAYYERLMSYTNSGACFSVILHSFVLRVIFDHGVVGLILTLVAVNYLLSRAGYQFRARSVIVAILIATGLSVSSLNNVYVALGLIFAVGLRFTTVEPHLLRLRSR